MIRLLAAASLLLACHAWNPCDWRADDARCALYDVDVSYDAGRRTVVAVVGYRATGPAGQRRAGKHIRYAVPPGIDPEDAINEVRAHIERHAAVPCTWRVVTRGQGTCVDQITVALPGCPDRGPCDQLRLLPR